MKKFFKFVGVFLLWMIAAVVLDFIILAIAIFANGGNPVSGANCSLITGLIIGVLISIVHFRNNKKKE